MLFLVKANEIKIGKIFELSKIYENSIWSASDNIINSPFGIYKKGTMKIHDKNPFIFQNNNGFGTIGDKKVEIYTFKYGKNYELIFCNDKFVAIKVMTGKELNDIIFYLEHTEEIFLIQYLIRANLTMNNNDTLDRIKPTNSIVSLQSINTLRDLNSKWFATTKIDGVTCLVAYLSDFKKILVIELQTKMVVFNNNMKIIATIPIELELNNKLFLGEYYEKTNSVYLFLEVNDRNNDFHIDIMHMKEFVEHYHSKISLEYRKSIKDITIVMNNIVIDADYKSLTKQIEEIKMKEKNMPITDGIVYGNVANKLHYKWKPPRLNTIDFYVYMESSPSNTIFLYTYTDNPYKVINHEKYKYKTSKFNIITSPFDKNTKFVLWKIQFGHYSSDVIKKFHNKIVECQYIGGQWILYIVLEDKITPNYHMVAINIMQTINNPIVIGDLLN